MLLWESNQLIMPGREELRLCRSSLQARSLRLETSGRKKLELLVVVHTGQSLRTLILESEEGFAFLNLKGKRPCQFPMDLRSWHDCAVSTLHIHSGLDLLFTHLLRTSSAPTGRNEFCMQELMSLWGKDCLFFNRVFLMKVFDFNQTCLMIIKSMCAELGTFLQQCVHVIYIFHINSLMRIHQSLWWNHRVPPKGSRSPRLTEETDGKAISLNNEIHSITRFV